MLSNRSCDSTTSGERVAIWVPSAVVNQGGVAKKMSIVPADFGTNLTDLVVHSTRAVDRVPSEKLR